MVLVRKATTGGASGRLDGVPWSYEWTEPGAALQVPVAVLPELFALPGGDYTVVDPGAQPSTAITEPADTDDLSEVAPQDDSAGDTPARRTRRTPKQP